MPYSFSTRPKDPNVAVSTASTPTAKYSECIWRIRSGRVTTRCSLQPSRDSPPKSSGPRSCACTQVPKAPSRIRTRSGKVARKSDMRRSRLPARLLRSVPVSTGSTRYGRSMDRAKVRHAAGDAARSLHRRLGDVVTPGYEKVPVAATFPVEPPVPDLGVPVADLVRMMRSVRLDNAGPGELEGYIDDSLGRFLHTTALAKGLEGDCLELGANPYFQTLCLQQCTGLRLTLANYFGEEYGDTLTQDLHYWDPTTRTEVTTPMTSVLFNTEEAAFPWPDASFDVVLFCEIIEHLLRDPVAVLREIRRVLRPGGTLIMTTPN